MIPEQLNDNPAFRFRSPAAVIVEAAKCEVILPATDRIQRAILRAYLLGQQDANTQTTAAGYALTNALFSARQILEQ